MLYLGFDVHSKWMTIKGFVAETGMVYQADRVPTTPEAVAAVLADWPTPRAGAMETGTNAWAVYRWLRPHLQTLVVAHAADCWDRRRDHSAKTDRRDALRLATLLAQGQLHPVYVPDDRTRELRALVRGQVQATQQQTQVVNTLGALVRSWGYVLPHRVQSRAGRAWLEALALPGAAQTVLAAWLRQLDETTALVTRLTAEIAAVAAADPVCRRLQTIPYVGPFTALTLRAEIGEIGRFPSADQLLRYAGLTPRVFQSGERCRYGRLSKQGDVFLRYAVGLWAQHQAGSTQDTPFRRTYYRLIRTHHPNAAKLAVGRELLRVVHSLWRHGTVWEPDRHPRVAS